MCGTGRAGQGMGGWRLPRIQHGLSPTESKMPDLPGAADEVYDSRFVKWMIKNKVGQVSARAPVHGFTGSDLLKGLMGQKPAHTPAMSPSIRLHPFQGIFHLHKDTMWAGRKSWPLWASVILAI